MIYLEKDELGAEEDELGADEEEEDEVDSEKIGSVEMHNNTRSRPRMINNRCSLPI